MSEESAERPPSRRLMAIEVQGEHRVLHDLAVALLRAIPLLPQGAVLERRGAYIDLHDRARADLRAEGSEVVRPGRRLVARSDVSEGARESFARPAHASSGGPSVAPAEPPAPARKTKARPGGRAFENCDVAWRASLA